MKLHKLTAGNGYLYLVRQVAAADSTERGHGSLGAYYAEKGEAPGVWWGAGLESLGVAGTVTEQQMKNLFGEGVHPNAQQVARELMGEGAQYSAAIAATRLGRKFPVYDGATAWRRRLGEAYGLWNSDHGVPSDYPVPAEERARIRTRVAGEMFAETYRRGAADERELAGFIARTSRPASSAVAGYDHTFTPVKSVSALWAIAPPAMAAEIFAAHSAAVRDAMGWMEDTCAYTRVGPRGVGQVDVRGLMAAVFVHRDSRAGEPNLHTHVAVSNKVQALDGRWLALDGSVWHRSAVAASERYNTRIEAELVTRLGVRFAEREAVTGKRPVREIVGVDPRLTARWSSRSAAIRPVREELSAQFRTEHGRPPSPVEELAIAQQATLQTRTAKHEPRSYAAQRQQWRSEAEQVLGGPAGVAQLIRGATGRRRGELAPGTAGLVTELARRTVEVVSHQRATWQLQHVVAEAQRQVRAADIHPAEVDNVVQAVTADVLAPNTSVPVCSTALSVSVDVPGELRRVDGSSIFTSHGTQQYTSEQVLAAERRIVVAAAMSDGRRAGEADVQVAKLEWSANHNGRVLNHGQSFMVEQMARGGRRVALALAPAGTGKTTAMGVLAAAWANSDGTVLGLAPRAVAAEELSAALGMGHAETIDKLVHELRHRPPQELPEWVRAVDARTLLIIDEAGVAPTAHLDTVIAFALQRGASVRLIADDRQRSSIAAGGVLRDIAAEHGALSLDEVVRFTDRTEGAASLALRAGDPAALGYYLDHTRVHAATEDTITDQVYSAWAADRAAGADAVMLAPTRDLVTALNARARADRLTTHGAGLEVEIAEGEVASAGDTILTTRNNRLLGLGGTDFVSNGHRWTIDTVHSDGSLTATHLHRGRSVRLPSAYVQKHVRLGYAHTIDSAQGITVGAPGRRRGVCHAVVTGRMDRGALYVAMTRGTDGNHAHVITGAGSDDHAVLYPDSTSPPSAAELLADVVARDASQRSATTQTRYAQNPAVRLAQAADVYLHGIRTAADTLIGEDRMTALTTAAETAVPGVTTAPAWDILRAHLSLLALDGQDPITLLTAARDQPELRTAGDLAAVLDWRLDRTGNHSQHQGPLPWLPTIPAVLNSHPVWSKYLHEAARNVTGSRAGVHALARGWTATTAPQWAVPFFGNQPLLADLTLWRAYNRTPDEDQSPAGIQRPATIALRHHHADLQQRANTHTGATAAADRWAQSVPAGLDAHLTRDPYWPIIASRLTIADPTGIAVPALLEAATRRGPLPDEQPAAALWWRIASHIQPTDTPAASRTSARSLPTWAEQLHSILGQRTGERITTDRLWPTITARVDTAQRDGHDPAELIASAAAQLRAHNELVPSDLASALLRRISLLADPQPIDKATIPPPSDELPSWAMAPTPTDRTVNRPDRPTAHRANRNPFRDRPEMRWTAIAEPYGHLAHAAQVEAIRDEINAIQAQIATLSQHLTTNEGPHTTAFWEREGRDLADRADQLRPYVVARDIAKADHDRAVHDAEIARAKASDLAAGLADGRTHGQPPNADFTAQQAWQARCEATHYDALAEEFKGIYFTAETDLNAAAGDQAVVTRQDVDHQLGVARVLDQDRLIQLRDQSSALKDSLFRVETMVESATPRYASQTTATAISRHLADQAIVLSDHRRTRGAERPQGPRI